MTVIEPPPRWPPARPCRECRNPTRDREYTRRSPLPWRRAWRPDCLTIGCQGAAKGFAAPRESFPIRMNLRDRWWLAPTQHPAPRGCLPRR